MRRMAPTPRFPLLILTLAILPGCFSTKPKSFPYPKVDFSDQDTGFQSSFLFNFAYRDSTVTSAPYTIYVQGATSSASSLQGVCNLAGTSCVCEFQDSAGAILETTDSTHISYEQTGNYYRCTQTTGAAAAKVRVHNIADNITSSAITVETSASLTLAKLIGADLSANNVRSIYSYSCNFTFLQKYGTTTTNFDCTNQTTTCNGDNFCLLQTRFPFYLYMDNYSTNFGLKIAEKLYNDSTTGSICGLQIAQYECADAQATPLKSFGLYGLQTGIWNTSVQLGAGPNLSLDTYGFAAQISPTTSECPPGLQKRVFYRVNPVSNTAATQSNYPANLVASQVGDPASAPSNLTINQIPGGHCDGNTCTLPSVGVNTVSSQSYSKTGETVFCVIPSTLLP